MLGVALLTSLALAAGPEGWAPQDVLGGTPALKGTFTLDQSVGVPFRATGTAALYAWEGAPEPTYYLTGTVTLPSQIVSGTLVCTPEAPAQNLDLSVAEIHNGVFRWGISAFWRVTCTDTASGGAASSQLIATLFDTMRINLTRCPGSYGDTQVSRPDLIQGSYTSDCGVEGTVSATWEFRACPQGADAAAPCEP